MNFLRLSLIWLISLLWDAVFFSFCLYYLFYYDFIMILLWRLWRWLPVIEWNNCFHLFESRMERRVVDGGLVVWLVKGTYFGFVLMDVSVSLAFRQLKMVMQRSNNADRAEIFKNRSYFNRITLIFYYSKYWIVDLR